MAKSMTAYGRASLQADEEIWTLEIFSVNKKGLEIHISLPKEYLFVDSELRKKIGQHVLRGQVTARLSKQVNAQSTSLPKSFVELLINQKTKWEETASLLGFSPKEEISLSFLLANLSSYDFVSDSVKAEFSKKIMEPLFSLAVKPFEEMKLLEGRALAKDVEARLQNLHVIVNEVENGCKDFPEKYKKKILERLKTISEVASDLEERAAKELAFLVEKMDVTEELVRLRSHISQMLELLLSKEKTIGKPFDFLLQEAFREVNTLGNKLPELAVIRLALEMKNELEKIKEQIQNVE